jgi:hypothetical protein
MSAGLERALVALALVTALLLVSAIRLSRTRSLSARVQLLGALSMLVVVFTHIAEALRLFPTMGWGEPHSVGHYIDLASAVTGIALLSAAFLLRLAR